MVKMGKFDVQEITTERRNKLYLYFKKKLQDFGCPDSYLPSTTDKMVKNTLRILKLKVEKE
jgi:hypothetical protein